MRKTGILLAVAVLVVAAAGCTPTRTHIRTETERIERVKDSKIIEPGSSSGKSETSTEEAGDTTTKEETETKERVIEQEPAIR